MIFFYTINLTYIKPIDPRRKSTIKLELIPGKIMTGHFSLFFFFFCAFFGEITKRFFAERKALYISKGQLYITCLDSLEHLYIKRKVINCLDFFNT